ncbi:ROK family protein [Streptomyces sp. NPDC005389]|uniref:ROK family protein n=1 Tax=Streptomyces sp. NPDC005389 TaxID=3157040 RepID=UPI0033B5C2A7
MNTQHVIALDVGGTGMKGALIGPALGMTATVHRPTPRLGGPDAVLDAIVGTITDLTREAAAADLAVARIGVVVPGIVDDVNGTVVYSANLGFDDLPLRRLLEERTGLPIAVGHDVRAGGLAEATLGAARSSRNSLFVAIGTGIAGSVITDGRTLGAEGYAGEIGHIVVAPGGPACACGARGCLETIASAPAIAAAFTARTGRAVRDASEVADLVRAGDEAASEVWNRVVEALATVLATLTTALGPQVIVVGGGLSEAGDLLLAPLRSQLSARLTFQRRPRVEQATLGDKAGCVGAGLLARAAPGRAVSRWTRNATG